MVIGLIRMVLDFVYLQPGCGESDDRPAVVKYVHYLYFSMILGVITLILVVAVSLLTEPPPEEMISRLTWFTRKDVPRKTDVPIPSLSIPVKGIHEAGPSPAGQLEITDGPENTFQNHSGPLDTKRKESKFMSLFLWVCGMESRDKDSPGTPAEPKAAVTAILDEAPLVKHILNINLILCISAGVFLWAYFA
ncbi:PREDICTED: sodium/myo-inositol cotransporter 2-like [Thamnophis sirtalis]|nr:PREDICTED: sodium/myo-inositol cotransporter 2-like [Thamnophis sirtalis]